jgi:hypothetical protein
VIFSGSTKKDTVEALGFTRMEAHRIQQLTPEAVEEAKYKET